jgi:hypothetical protein
MPSADAFDFDEAPALQGIYWRDEILQLMYWLKGEGLLDEVTADDLRRFLATDPGRLEVRLDQLVQEGYLESASEDIARYRLSTWGIDEGRRRFVDEFTPFLGRESHVECGDPGCECHTSGVACPRLQERQGAS